jgi:hypothetical protein
MNEMDQKTTTSKPLFQGMNLLSAITSSALLLFASCTSYDGTAGNPLSLATDIRAMPANPSSLPPAQSESAVGGSEAFAKPAKERPGLATTWGESVKQPLGDIRFTRATPSPAGVDAIFYNNHEGLEAMDAKDWKVDGIQQAAGGIIEWGIKGSLGMLPAYKSWTKNGYRRFVQGSHGSSYSIVIKNRCKCRVQVVVSVDGLDVLDGQAASVKKTGYVIAPESSITIKGFRTSYDAVAAFQFSSVSQSYANLRHGETRNVGVIGLAAYTEKGFDPWTWMPKEINQRETAQPFATAR